MRTILFTLSMLLMFAYFGHAKKCRALAMSGGGNKGAYQAGVIMTLSNLVKNPEEELAWDVITGVSAGSLNTLAMSAYEPHDIHSAAEFVYALWNSIPDYQAYGNWPGGILQGLFFKSSIFDLQPGIDWVTGQWGDRTINRKCSFATVDANAAEYEVFDYNATGTLPGDVIESAFASSSIPGAFPPVQRGEMTLIDGGVIWNLDVPSAIRRCKEIVDDEKDIVVDFFLCGDHSMESVEDLARYSTLEHYYRGKEIKSFYNGMQDYNSSVEMYPDVEFRYIIAPSEDLAGGLLPLDFSRKQIDKCYEVAEKDAKAAVTLGSGGYGKILLDYTEKMKNGEEANLNEMIQQAVLEKSYKVKTESQ